MPQHIKVFENVLTPDFCEKVIQRFDQDARVQPDPQPGYSTRNYLNVSLCPEWRALNTTFCRHVNELVHTYFNPEGQPSTHTEWSDDGYVVVRYEVGDTCILHVDGQCAVEPNNGLRLATVIFYLNDVAVGGETHFPVQDVRVRPVRGRAVVFPVGFTHPHEALAAGNSRYIMQTWITDPRLLVVANPDAG